MVAGAVLATALRHLSPARLRLVGGAATAAGLASFVVFTGYDLMRWLETAPAEYRRYFFQRVLFYLGTNPYVPLFPLTTAGVAGWIVGRIRSKKKRPACSPVLFDQESGHSPR
jgi:hypothetical protein